MPAMRRRRAMPRRAASWCAAPSSRCARRPRKGRARSSPSTTRIDTLSSDQKFIQRELPRALSAGELELHYQPIVAARGAPHRRRRSAAALDPCRARADRAGAVHSGRRADGADGRSRRLRAAARARRRQALAGPLYRGQPVAAAGARRLDRRDGARGARRKRRRAVAADAGNHRGRADRQSRTRCSSASEPARSRRAHCARRFRLRLFQSRLSAALSDRQAQDRQELRGARSAPRPTAA